MHARHASLVESPLRPLQCLSTYPAGNRTRVNSPARILACLLCSLLTLPVMADELRYVVSGVSEPLLTNVRQHLDRFGFTESRRLAARRFDALRIDTEARVAEALKPYGYYVPEISSSISQVSEETWEMRIQIQPGAPL